MMNLRGANAEDLSYLMYLIRDNADVSRLKHG